MKRLEPFEPGRASERSDDYDTLEHQTRGSREHRNQSSTRGSRGYWIGAEEGGAVPGERPPSAHSRRRTTRRPRRRILLWMGFSMVVLVTLVIVAVLALTGEMVVPWLSDRLYPMRYQQDIARVADKYGQDPYLIAAMVKTESGYDPLAESSVGAVGLMQLMPGTAEEVAAKLHLWSAGDGPVLTDPADNLELGAYYLAYLGEIYGDGSAMALAAYNAGQGHVDEWIQAAGGSQSFDQADIPFPETRQYVQRVEHYTQLYKRLHPDAFTRN